MNKSKLIEKLKALYSDNSKHSRYQNIPAFVRQELGYTETINENWRGDTARYNYLLSQFDFTKEMIIGDIGANTGFFSLSLAHKYPNLKIYAYECNPKHVEHIEIIKDYFSISNLYVEQEMLNLKNIDNLKHHDLIINFNVLHHAGVDYDQDIVNLENFESYATSYLAKLREKSKKMIFQMGYNWGGNKQKPIIEVNDGIGFIFLVTELFSEAKYNLEKIVLFNHKSKQYVDIGGSLINNLKIQANVNELSKNFYDIFQEIDFYKNSEFYKRPIFIVEFNNME